MDKEKLQVACHESAMQKLPRQYHAPAGVLGAYVTIILYVFMLIFADKIALLTALIVTIGSVAFYMAYTRNKSGIQVTIAKEIGYIEEPTDTLKKKMDKEYRIWKWVTIITVFIAMGIYILPMVF